MLFHLSFPLLENPLLREVMWRSVLGTVLRNGGVGAVYPEEAGGYILWEGQFQRDMRMREVLELNSFRMFLFSGGTRERANRKGYYGARESVGWCNAVIT